MIWNETLTDLHTILVKHYHDKDSIERICTMCNIQVQGVNFQGSAMDIWYSVMKEASQDSIKRVAERLAFEKEVNLEGIIEKFVPKKEELIHLQEFKLNIRRHDYPRPKAYFAGRVQELKDLNEAYQTNQIIFIEGAGGIGKTQFIAKFIEGFPQKDRIIWFDCNPTSQPDDVILGAGFDELLKGKDKTEREKFSAFKDKIQEFELVIFLDNYQEVENNPNFKFMLAFLNEHLSKGHVFVIGRDNIVTPSLQLKLIPLKGLGDNSVEHARKLLEHAYSNTKDVSDATLIKICYELRGYPLAIDLAMYLLSEGESEKNILQAAVDEAMSAESGNETISQRLLNAIFTRPDATDDEKNFLKLISVFRGRIDKEAAQAISSPELYQAWRKLVKKNLLTNESYYFDIHPLIREFSYKELDDKLEIHFKAADYFASKRTDKLDIDLEASIFFHFSQAKRWHDVTDTIIKFGREFILKGYLERLQNMITSARDQGESQVFFDILEGDIAEIKGEWDKSMILFEKAMDSTDDGIRIEGTIKSGEMHFRKGQPHVAKKLFEIGVKASEKMGFVKWQARALNDLGLIHNFWGEKKYSLECLDKALSMRKMLGDLEDIAISLSNIGNVKSKSGLNKEALNLYEESLEIQKEIGNKSGISHSLINIGNVKSRLGQNNEALKLYEESLNIQVEIGEKSGISYSLNNIGNVRSSLGQKKEALKLHEESLKIRKEIGDKSGIAYSLNNIGNVRSSLGQKKEALELFEQGLKIQKEIGDKSGIAIALSNIGSVKDALGQKKEALELFEQGLKIQKEIEDKSGIANALSNIGNVKRALGQKKEALRLFEESLKIQKEIEDVPGIAYSLIYIGNVKSDLGQKKEALKFYEKSLKIRKEIGHKSGIAYSLNNIGTIKNSLGQKREELKMYEESLMIQEEIEDKEGIALSLNNIGSFLFENNGASEKICINLLKSIAIYHQIGMPDFISPFNWLKKLKQKVGVTSFKILVDNAFAAQVDELKPYLKMEEILGLPVKVEKETGRNAPCPCGSGMKYKQCHGRR